MLRRALANPRTTIPAWLGAAAGVVGAGLTAHTGTWLPLLVGLALRELGYTIAHGNAKDAEDSHA